MIRVAAAGRGARPARAVGRWILGAAAASALALGAIAVLPDVFGTLWYLAYAIAGAVLVVRRTTNPIGWLLLLIMLGFVGDAEVDLAQVAAMESRTAGPVLALKIWIGSMSGVMVFLGYAALAIVFPAGQLPGGRWRLPVAVLLAMGLALALLTAIAPTISVTVGGGLRTVSVPNPFAVEPGSPVWSVLPHPDVAFVPIVGLLVIGVGSIIVRYHRSTGLLRLQLRWLVTAMTLTVVSVAGAVVFLLVAGDTFGPIAWIPTSIAFLSIPLSIMVAILRYRLLDIDRLVSRTIGWALATGVLAAVFVAGTLALQAVLAGLTQGETIAIATSTLVAAALFQPVRKRLQRVVDRRFDRSRYDRDVVVSAFGGQMRDELDLRMLRRALVETSHQVVRPASVSVWLRAADPR